MPPGTGVLAVQSVGDVTVSLFNSTLPLRAVDNERIPAIYGSGKHETVRTDGV